MREVNVCLKVLVVMVGVYRKQHHRDFQSQQVVFSTASRVIVMDPGTGVFLSILRNFQEHLFYRTPLGDCFCIFIIMKNVMEFPCLDMSNSALYRINIFKTIFRHKEIQ